MDAGYLTLLDLLQRSKGEHISLIPKQQILGAITHYLTTIPIQHVSSFVQTIATSASLWDPVDFDRVADCHSAFRQAVSLKLARLKGDSKVGDAYVSQILRIPINQWMGTALMGVSDKSNPPRGIIRLAIIGGLLSGMEDVASQNRIDMSAQRTKFQEETIKSAGEVLALVDPDSARSWEEEFNPDIKSSALHLLQLALLLVPPHKLSPLPLLTLSHLLSEGISDTFNRGFSFLGCLALHTSVNTQGETVIGADSPVQEALQSFISSRQFASVGHTCQLLARVLDVLVERTDDKARIFHHIRDIISSLGTTAENVERYWSGSLLSSVEDEAKLSLSTRPTTTSIWTAFKTLIFANVMVSQSSLSIITFYPGAPTREIALAILSNLGHLSFISSKFGTQASGGGFKQHQRTFFGALDVLSSNTGVGEAIDVSDTFLRTLAMNLKGSRLASDHPVLRSRTAFFLACAEQLVASISDNCLEEVVLPIANQFLNDVTHREVYESAHSVMLSVFASLRNQATIAEVEAEDRRTQIAEHLAPSYLRSLLENSQEGRLSTEQLCLAFASLVGSASSAGIDGLAWLCIDKLLDVIQERSTSRSQKHRLRMTLISLIPAVNTTLLPRVLSRVEEALTSADAEERTELWKTVSEMMERVGDKGKELSLKWWLTAKDKLDFSEIIAPGLSAS